MALFEPLFAALNAGEVRYVVVGDLAVVLHGHARLTPSVELVVDLTPAEAAKAVRTLLDVGLRPREAVEALNFADPQIRSAWVHERNIRVFSLWDPANPICQVDLFAEYPIPFEELWKSAAEIPLEGTSVRVASIEDLIRVERLAGRPVHRQNVPMLEEILRTRRSR